MIAALQCVWYFCLCRRVFHDCVSIRKALKAVSQVHDGQAGSDRRGAPRYPYSAGSVGLVEGTGYPTRKCMCLLLQVGWVFVTRLPDKFDDQTRRRTDFGLGFRV